MGRITHQVTGELEQGAEPDHEPIAAVGELIDESVRDGVLVVEKGSKPASRRTHSASREKKRTITDGPFTEAKEVVA